MSSRPPIVLEFMIACHASSNPAADVGHECWDSRSGIETRSWLRDNDLIDNNNQSTERGIAWIRAFTSTPLPVVKWVQPKKGEEDETPWK